MTEDSEGCHLEVIPRADGSLHISGLGESQKMRGAALRQDGVCAHAGCPQPDLSRVAAGLVSLDRLVPGLLSVAEEDDTFPSGLKNENGDATIRDGRNRLPPWLQAQGCLRPGTPDSRPCVGRVPGLNNALICAGHGV